MRQLKNLLPILLICLVPGIANSQEEMNSSYVQSTLYDMQGGGSMFRSFDNRFKGTEGSVMLFDNYIEGVIYMSMGKMIKHNQVNYDAYKGDLLIKREGKEFVVTMNQVRRFVLINDEGDSLKFTKQIGPDAKVGFYQELARYPKVGLYKKMSKVLIEPTYQGAYSPGKNYAEFVEEQKLMVYQPGRPLGEFKNKNSFLAQFPDHRPAIASYCKENKIDFKNEDSLKKLIGYINGFVGN